MKSILKWILVIGIILSGLLLMGSLIFNQSSVTSFWHGGLPYAGHHSTFGSWTAYPGIIGGVIYFLLLIGGLFLAIRPNLKTSPASEVRSDALETCPACDADLEQKWNNCPFCGYDLS